MRNCEHHAAVMARQCGLAVLIGFPPCVRATWRPSTGDLAGLRGHPAGIR